MYCYNIFVLYWEIGIEKYIDLKKKIPIEATLLMFISLHMSWSKVLKISRVERIPAEISRAEKSSTKYEHLIMSNRESKQSKRKQKCSWISIDKK